MCRMYRPVRGHARSYKYSDSRFIHQAPRRPCWRFVLRVLMPHIRLSRLVRVAATASAGCRKPLVNGGHCRSALAAKNCPDDENGSDVPACSRASALLQILGQPVHSSSPAPTVLAIRSVGTHAAHSAESRSCEEVSWGAANRLLNRDHCRSVLAREKLSRR